MAFTCDAPAANASKHASEAHAYERRELECSKTSSCEMSANAIWILVSGKRYAGKDTVANLLAERLRDAGRCVVRTSFALGVKTDTAITYGLDLDRLLNDAAYKEEHRALLIAHGKAMREKDESYWIAQAWNAANVSIAMQNGRSSPLRPIVIVSDWRFVNEGEWIARRTSVIRVRVHANNWARAARGWVYNAAVDSDVSEVALDEAHVDVNVTNEGEIVPALIDPIIAAIK